jgi:GNAT superfamily N-acetyltransferase
MAAALAAAVAAVAAAATAADKQRLCAAAAAAAQQHFATLEVEGRLVAAALFYPRASTAGSSLPPVAAQRGDVGSAGGIATASGSTQLDPHCHLELICTNAPGRGWGSLLLQHVERYAAAHAAGRLALGGQPLRCLKLLSVGSAQSFYRANGYSEPDACKEMHKLLCDVRL